jgi:putative Mg2+ transporter-C (MgtC) family protein
VPDLDPSFQLAASNLFAALVLGGLIGFERQWRQRLAGLRTNTLVSLGAATFVVYATQFTDSSPTRVAAQVVTGIGFLGAGVIWKDGINVGGLNTAATLWCSGAVGLLAGSGHWSLGLVAVVFVIGVNLLLHPLDRLINRQPIETAEVEFTYTVNVVARGSEEAKVRTVLVEGFGTDGLRLRELESADIEGTEKVDVTAVLIAAERCDLLLEKIVGRLSLEPAVSAARWSRTASVV